MKHGTESVYVHHRCRCTACTNAATDARRGRWDPDVTVRRAKWAEQKRSQRKAKRENAT